MASRKSKSASRQETKRALKVLKKKGLYSGDLRREPTDYGKRLARRYSDVLSGKAAVVSVPRMPGKRSSGEVAARKQAQAVADAYATQIRRKGRHLIVQTATKEDKAVYLPKQKAVEIYRTRNAETVERIRLEPVGKLQVQSDNTVEYVLRDLKSGEAYYVPFVGKNGGVRYVAFADKAALSAALNKYQQWGDVQTQIVISRLAPKRRRKGNAYGV